jgi:Arc/MetJ-type ribon-helix-helix transcriptional regulator
MAEVQQVQQLPAPFIEAAGKDYFGDLTKAIGGAKGIDPSKFMGQGFVAPQDQFTTDAYALSSGLGSYAPYLTAAAGATGPTAYQSYYSPYQQDVIKTTMDQFDVQAQKGLPSLAAAAYGADAYGGGRAGVQRAEYQSASDMNRAALYAQLQQAGYGQAQQGAQQNYANQMNLAQAAPALAGSQIAGLTTLGGARQGQEQALLEAQKQLEYQKAYQPLQIAERYGTGIAPMISGYPGQTQQTISPSPSGLGSVLGAGTTLAGIYRLMGAGTQDFKGLGGS